MPTIPYDMQRKSARFSDQRWLLDAVIRLNGPEWDQGRLHYYSAPCGTDYTAPIMSLGKTIKKLDDMTPQMAAVAKRFEMQGRASAEDGHQVTAGEQFFAASVMYGAAQWAIFAQTELNTALEKQKTICYAEYIVRADHTIEAVSVPYDGRRLKGYFHLPQGYTAGELPCIVMVTGMDAFKEQDLGASGDRYLRRGFAVLCLDVPGQGSSLPDGIWYEPEKFAEVGVAAYELMSARAEIDSTRIMLWGLSFGSLWATQMAAAESRYAACAVMFTCFQPENWIMSQMGSSSFSLRLMFMTGAKDDAEFQKILKTIDPLSLGARMKMPSFVLAGEDDELTDFGKTVEHVNHIRGPKTLLVYSGELHGLSDTRSSLLGPPAFPFIADWLADRAADKHLDSAYIVVDQTGQVHTQPYGASRVYQYGAPLGIESVVGGS